MVYGRLVGFVLFEDIRGPTVEECETDVSHNLKLKPTHKLSAGQVRILLRIRPWTDFDFRNLFYQLSTVDIDFH